MKYSIIFSISTVPFAAAAGNVCSSGLLPLFAPLSTWPAAVSYCSSKYPGTTTAVTVTAPTSSTTIFTTSTVTHTPTAPYYKRRRDVWKRFQHNMENVGLDPRSPAASTTAITKNVATPTTVTPTPVTPTTTAALTTTSTTTAACGTGKAKLFCDLVAQASTLVSQFCSCYDPPVTTTTTATVTPVSTSTSVIVVTTQVPQQTLACPSFDRLGADPASDIIEGTGCPSKSGVNCACGNRVGTDPTQVTGPGVCRSGYQPNEPCTSDADCSNGKHCLGYPDPSSFTYVYYCSITQTCVDIAS